MPQLGGELGPAWTVFCKVGEGSKAFTTGGKNTAGIGVGGGGAIKKASTYNSTNFAVYKAFAPWDSQSSKNFKRLTSYTRRNGGQLWEGVFFKATQGF